MVRDPETGEIDPNLERWSVTSADSSEIIIQLKFDEPVAISQG